MSDVPFYRTQMGHRYYEHTLPELVRQLARVADVLERTAARREAEEPADASQAPERLRER